MKDERRDLVVAVIIMFIVGCIIAVPVYDNIIFNEKDILEMKSGAVHVDCPQWQGSGFIVSEHLIATARHVVEGVEDFTITFDDGSTVHATKAISDKNHDVAFIWVDEPMKNVVRLGSIKDCALGDEIYTIGCPYGKVNFNSVTLGIVAGKSRDYDGLGTDYGWSVSFQTDSPGHPGNSGCPVFSKDGVVRGILVGGFSPSLIICMPCDLFMNDLDTITLMFEQDRYYFEETPEYYDEAVW